MKRFFAWYIVFAVCMVIWNICKRIGETYNISSLLVLFLFILGFIALIIIVCYLLLLSDKRFKEKLKKCENIRNKYPLTYKDFCSKNAIELDHELDVESVEKILVIPDIRWEEQEKKLAELKLKEKIKAQKEEEDKIKQERARQEEERKKNALPLLRRCVSSWHTLTYDFPYTFLLHYYPTTCPFEATNEEWHDRWLVWNFKNTPDKTSEEQHEKALNVIISDLTMLLQNTFGSYLDLLTLVCIPASSKINNYARYAVFSKRLTRNTNMENAFDHIHFVKEATPKHLGGTGYPILQFDENYFSGRYILLFDDIITKGDSMVRFKRELENLGAIVIAGVSIGKTTHERLSSIL